MENGSIKDILKKKLVESGVYGFGASQEQMPVQQATWPSTDKTAELPSSSQVNVTNGETTEVGQPRADVAAQNAGATNINDEVMGEISSLLISIGYILSSAGAVPDKFDTAAVLKVLNDKFAGGNVLSPSPVIAEPVTTAEPVDPAATGTFSVATYMEQRKLMESRFKNKT